MTSITAVLSTTGIEGGSQISSSKNLGLSSFPLFLLRKESKPSKFTVSILTGKTARKERMIYCRDRLITQSTYFRT